MVRLEGWRWTLLGRCCSAVEIKRAKQFVEYTGYTEEQLTEHLDDIGLNSYIDAYEKGFYICFNLPEI